MIILKFEEHNIPVDRLTELSARSLQTLFPQANIRQAVEGFIAEQMQAKQGGQKMSDAPRASASNRKIGFGNGESYSNSRSASSLDSMSGRERKANKSVEPPPSLSGDNRSLKRPASGNPEQIINKF